MKTLVASDQGRRDILTNQAIECHDCPSGAGCARMEIRWIVIVVDVLQLGTINNKRNSYDMDVCLLPLFRRSSDSGEGAGGVEWPGRAHYDRVFSSNVRARTHGSNG
jgi:hypothetical protein